MPDLQTHIGIMFTLFIFTEFFKYNIIIALNEKGTKAPNSINGPSYNEKAEIRKYPLDLVEFADSLTNETWDEIAMMMSIGYKPKIFL